MNGFPYLFWGYNVVWICLAGYLAYLVVRMGRLDRRLERLETELRGREDTG